MYNFLVLGIIPGTNLQITFGMWLLMCAVLTFKAPALWRKYEDFLRGLATPSSHLPLHASQLHHRLSI